MSASDKLKDIADRFERGERLTGPGWAAEIREAAAEADALVRVESLTTQLADMAEGFVAVAALRDEYGAKLGKVRQAVEHYKSTDGFDSDDDLATLLGVILDTRFDEESRAASFEVRS